MTVWAAASLMALGLVSCGDETDTPSAAQGKIIGGIADSVDGASATVTLPTGTVTLTVGRPVDEVGSDESRDAKTHRAPSGASFVPVHVDYDVSRAPWSGLLALHPKEAPVTVRAGDQQWQLESPYDVSGKAIADNPETTFYLPADGRPSAEDVSYDVSYDGRSLGADLSGGDSSTDPLTELSDAQPDPVNCPSSGWSATRDMEATVACDISWAGRTPYWPGQGWADDGDWQVIRVARLEVTDLTSAEGNRQIINEATDDSATGAGDRSGTPLEGAPEQPARLVGTLVFAATPGEQLDVELATMLSARPENGSGQLGKVTVSLTKSFR